MDDKKEYESNINVPSYVQYRKKWKTSIMNLLEGVKEGSILGRKFSFDNPETFQSFNKVPEHLRLEEHIELQHLHELMELFDEHRPETRVVEGTSKYAPTKYEHREPGALNPQEFKDTIAGVLETRRYDEQLDKLFTKLDTSADGFVDWNEFATYMLLHYRENDYLRTKKEIPFMHEARIRHILQNRQENTMKIVALDNPWRFVTINRDGIICFWSSSMQLETTAYTDPELEDGGSQKRRFKMWITDATYMPNCHKFVTASTRRDIRFYDIAGNQMMEDYHLYGLNHVPHCLTYHYNENEPNNEAMLIWGDEHGDVHILKFKSPVTQLFEKAFSKQRQTKTRIYMQDLGKHDRWVMHTVVEGQNRDEPIKRVRYIADNDMIITGSASPKNSVVITDRKGYKKPYTFKLTKGVQCFDHNKKLNLLATGAADHTVRLWNPYVTNKPITSLEGHYSAVIDVVIYEMLEQVFSYSSDAVLKVWDVKDYTCLQTILLKFPTSLHGHIPDHGPFPLHLHAVPGSHHNCLLIACNDYIGKLKLGLFTKPVEDIPRTHNAQLCSAIYNEFFREVVTGADDSSISAWDFETGNKNLVFTNAHGEEEITCMAFDGNWRRLITGARNGTVKVWNFQNGHNLHKLEPVDDTEVTGVLSLIDKQFMLSVGWSRKITKYDDSEGDNLYIEADDSWKGGMVHKDDILDLAYCPPYLLATGSFDGEILVWTLETEKLLLRIDANSADGKPDLKRPPSSRRHSRPNSKHRRSGAGLPPGPGVPVDKLQFIQYRIDSKLAEAAILVSSQGGTLRWWSLFGTRHLLGEYPGTDFPGESILAMSGDTGGTTLITGDTQGFIYSWDITSYCLKPEPQLQVSSQKPPLRHLWRAHESTVVSLQYIEHTAGDFILSASTDKTARLWTCDGKFIGTFGQSKEWHVADPSTWIYPIDPFSEEYFLSQINPPTPHKVKENSAESTDTKEDEIIIEEIEMLNKEDISENQLEIDDVQLPVPPKCPQAIARAATIDQPSKEWIESDLQIKEKARTFHQSSLQPTKSMVGIKADTELFRKRKNRQERRGQFGHVDTEKTNRLGLLCCPFQALATQTMNPNLLPKDLPVTNRMIQRGYTSNNLDENLLRTMDLSILLDDDPEKRRIQKLQMKKLKSRLPAINTRSNTMLSSKQGA